jgi:hypothetical protein
MVSRLLRRKPFARLSLGLASIALLLSAVVANAVGWKGHFLFFTPPILLANLAINLLASGLTAGQRSFLKTCQL